MIRVCCSNRTEALLQAFVHNMQRERQSAGPFAPVRVVVPNRNVETYLRLGVARACGIAANLQVTFLRKLLGHVAEQALPNGRVVDAQQIEAHLLALFHDDGFLARPGMAPVRDYLRAGGEARDAVDRRRCQLAFRLGPLFEEYAASRADMVKAWETKATLDDDHLFAATEAWQRALWLAIFGSAGRIAFRSQAEGVAWLRIDELLARAEALGKLPADELGPTLHLFGASYVAPAYHRMLALLARPTDVYLYTLNPCREFWEDVETPAELRRRLAKMPKADNVLDDPFGLLDPSENLALRLWGRPGRENLRLLNQLDACDFEEHFAASAAPTLLARVQNDILDRVARAEPDPTLAADGSLQVLACPGIRRELEVVAAEIWRCLRTQPDLRCNDIAVIVPESRKAAYLSQVSPVFAESRDLPHHVVDLPLAGGHRLGEAAQMLIDLPFSSFSRKELVPLLTHPSLMARFPEARATDWLHLIDELGIVRGAEQRDLAGSYLERDLLTWDQGLRRLALGAFMLGERSGDDTPVSLGEDQYLPVETAPDDRTAALGFALLVRSLIADARFAAGKDGPIERPLREWLDFIRGMLAAYLAPSRVGSRRALLAADHRARPSEASGVGVGVGSRRAWEPFQGSHIVDDSEEGLLGHWRASLDEIEDVGLHDLPVSYRVAAELARGALVSVPGSRGQYLARGVTVASFVPMRAIPFRVVFVLGLGQGDFPRSARRGDLDLREARREPGDVTPREQDLYMFLEMLLCARDRLVLSYVGRDEITGEKQPPSAVLLELREILSSYLTEAEVGKLFDADPPPLRRYNDIERLDALPLARTEHTAQNLGKSLRAVLPDAAAAPTSVEDLRRALSPSAFSEVASRLSLPAPLASAEPIEAPNKVVVTLADLRHFLEDPLQGSARFRLRLRESQGDDELADLEDEPFAMGRLNRTTCLREAMVRAVLASAAVPSPEEVAARYDEISLREELAGRGPAGLFREAEREHHTVILNQWTEQLGRIAGSGSLRSRVLHFGRAFENEDAREILPAITIELPAEGEQPPLRVEVQGRTSVLVETADSPRASVTFTCRLKDTAEETRLDKESLATFLDHVALAAAGLSQPQAGHRGLILLTHGARQDIEEHRFAALAMARARDYLARLVRDMLTGTLGPDGEPTGLHAYFLPCEAIFHARRMGTLARDEAASLSEQVREGGRTSLSTQYGPIRDAVTRWNPPSAEAAARIATDRFGLYFELETRAK
jgi:exodeoxyribonuclease V gamma subunit